MTPPDRCLDCGGIRSGGGALADLQAPCTCPPGAARDARAARKARKLERIRPLVAEGLTAKAIAERLGMSPGYTAQLVARVRKETT